MRDIGVEMFGRFFITLCCITYFFSAGKNISWILYIIIPIIMLFWIFNVFKSKENKA